MASGRRRRPPCFSGKMVHHGLEILYRHRQLCVELSTEDVASRMIGDWDETVDTESMQFESTEEEGALKKQAVDLVAAYMEHTADTLETPLAVETSMEAPLVDPIHRRGSRYPAAWHRGLGRR